MSNGDLGAYFCGDWIIFEKEDLMFRAFTVLDPWKCRYIMNGQQQERILKVNNYVVLNPVSF